MIAGSTLFSNWNQWSERGSAELSSAVLGAQITSVTSDSRAVGKGTLFVALQGTQSDGHDFLTEAYKKGAVVLIGEKPCPKDLPEAARNIYLQVESSASILGLLASRFSGSPSHEMLVIGITGTSGKTTSSFVMESILKAAGKRVGLIGTVVFRYEGKKGLVEKESTHTTPGAVEIQALLKEMKEAGCEAVVMEVSSHALKQARVRGIAFDGAIFTNLTPEHLDFHPTMEDYFESKALLFGPCFKDAIQAGKHPKGAINGEDPWGHKLFERLKSEAIDTATFIKFKLPPWKQTLHGIEGSVSNYAFQSPFLGAFNALNIQGTVTLAQALDIPAQLIAKGVASLPGVPGRLELVRSKNANAPQVIVDYAHKPDALEKVLKALRELKEHAKASQSQIITVFGCGGDRDRTKRPLMGEIACRLSDQVVVTSDNPRTEEPMAIIAEVLSGVPRPKIDSKQVRVEPDRKQAIRLAIQLAGPKDLVLIAGKGHEDYQIIADPKASGGTRKISFDDRKVAAEALLDFGF